MAARKTATKKKVTKKKTAKKSARKKPSSSRKRLTPSKEKRGLSGAEIVLTLGAREVAPLVRQVEAAGGAAIGAYREPLSGRPMLIASLPLASVEPTPFQRDLSPTHTKRLAEKIEQSGSFLDPLIVVRGDDGRLWTPNGRHRLAAAKVLGLRQVTALVSPDEDLAFRILALNTEKAHNLKDRSLEVIRMARGLVDRKPRAKETAYAEQFEAPELLTLGIVYEQNKRFAGGAYSPLLKKVDRFVDKTLGQSIRQREGYAARIEEIDAQVKEIIEALRTRGFKSPYLRTYVVARINPVRFHRAKKGETKPAMAIGAALTRMASAARNFDVASVRQGDLALVAAIAPDDE
ncbi:MAG: ParB N-terminal domain-containing protein [Planctomycetes bacterium]|nr:ParB N-terminal domain-containing protein [Planctomycetota bacterium]